MSKATEPVVAGAPPAGAQVLCIVLHGRNGSPETMIDELVRHLTAPAVHFVLPRAPGRSWYDAPSCNPLAARTRDQIRAGIEQIRRDVDRAQRNGAPRDRIVIGGFSQGACMTLEYALAGGPWPGAAFCLTGCRVGCIGDARPASDLASMPVYLGNGARDPFIRLPEFAETLRELGAAGARVRSDIFPREAHVMSPAEIATVDAMLRAVAEGAPLFAGSAA
jgi:phospholipase/carboxylesterase